MSSAYPSAAVPSEDRGEPIDPDNPPNPGSREHPHNCKPCNKYNPNRPEDSCKHARTCAFCHGKDHERPKHRGQRGRHALQRRQYLETREGMPEKLRELVDQVYEVPPAVMEECKKRLQTLDAEARELQVQAIVKSIADIGDQAQGKRPDNQRVRGARMEAQEYTATSDLDSRFKWLTGTLHLMCRKMWENDDISEDERLHEMLPVVSGILVLCQKLPEELDERLAASSSVQDLVNELRLGEQSVWVEGPLLKLAEWELAKGSSRAMVKEVLVQFEELIEQLPPWLPPLVDASQEAKRKLVACQSLDQMHTDLVELVDTIKELYLDQDCLDDLTDEKLGKLLLAKISSRGKSSEDLRFGDPPTSLRDEPGKEEEELRMQ